MKKAIILEYKRLDTPPLTTNNLQKLRSTDTATLDEVVGSFILVGAAVLHALWKSRNK